MKKDRILIVHDDALLRAIYVETLEDMFDIKVVSSGAETFESVFVFLPDLILLDSMMPGINGYEICEKLRELLQEKNIKILMVSARAMVKDRVKGYEVGADDYITKPFDPEELLAKVDIWMKVKKIENVERLQNNCLNILSNKAHMLQCVESGQQMFDLVNKTKLLCNLYKGIKLMVMDSDINQLVSQVVIEVTKEKDAKVSFIKSEEVMEVAVDRKLMSTAFLCALNFMVWNSSRKGEISVCVEKNNHQCIVRMSFVGGSLSEEQLRNIFKEIIDSHQDLEWQNYSLGMVVARNIAREHQGEIVIENNVENGVSCVVNLPLY